MFLVPQCLVVQRNLLAGLLEWKSSHWRTGRVGIELRGRVVEIRLGVLGLHRRVVRGIRLHEVVFPLIRLRMLDVGKAAVVGIQLVELVAKLGYLVPYDLELF